MTFTRTHVLVVAVGAVALAVIALGHETVGSPEPATAAKERESAAAAKQPLRPRSRVRPSRESAPSPTSARDELAAELAAIDSLQRTLEKIERAREEHASGPGSADLETLTRHEQEIRRRLAQHEQRHRELYDAAE